MNAMAKPPLARNIVLRRKALGWKSAIEFAEALGMPYPTLRDIETGASGGRKENIEKIAKKLNCTVSDLYSESKSSARSEDSLVARIIELLPSASEEKLKAVLDLLDHHEEKAKSRARNP